MSMMGFFDRSERDEADDQEEDEFDDSEPPWVAGVVPLELLLARSDQAAVTVSAITVYPERFSLTVNSFLRPSVKRRGHQRRALPILRHELDDRRDPVPDEMLRFGLAWPDGGRATNLDWVEHDWPDATRPSHGLEEGSGSGTDHQYSTEYWAWPVPDSGQLTIVVEWPFFEVEETVTVIDATLFGEASRRAHPVWPKDADRG